MNHCSRGSRVILLMCLLINTYIHMYTYTYVCIYILQLNSILIVLWVLDGFSKQSGGLFKSYSVHWEIHGFTLLKERLTCSWTTGLGQLKMMVYKCSSHSPRGQKEGKDPDQTILTSPVSAERRGYQLHRPLMWLWLRGTSAAWPTLTDWAEESKYQSWKVLKKKLNSPTRMKLKSRGDSVACLCVHS